MRATTSLQEAEHKGRFRQILKVSIWKLSCFEGNMIKVMFCLLDVWDKLFLCGFSYCISSSLFPVTELEVINRAGHSDL